MCSPMLSPGSSQISRRKVKSRRSVATRRSLAGSTRSSRSFIRRRAPSAQPAPHPDVQPSATTAYWTAEARAFLPQEDRFDLACTCRVPAGLRSELPIHVGAALGFPVEIEAPILTSGVTPSLEGDIRFRGPPLASAIHRQGCNLEV